MLDSGFDQMTQNHSLGISVKDLASLKIFNFYFLNIEGIINVQTYLIKGGAPKNVLEEVVGVLKSSLSDIHNLSSW